MGEVFEATSPEAALGLLSDARGAVRIHSHSARTAMRLVQRAMGPVSLDQITFGMDADVDLGPSERLVFGQVVAGAVGLRRGGVERWHTQGDVYLASQPGLGRTALVRGGAHEQAVVAPATVSEIAETEPGRTRQPVRFTGFEPISPQAARVWKTTYAYVLDALLSTPDAAGQPLIAASASRLLVATALATFPNTAYTDPTIEDRRDAHPATVRRATAFIDENARLDITVADIAAAANVTIRAIQLAFRRHLDMTPTEYLRRVRLDHAHRDLSTADPARDSVTAVAYRWGFSSPSQFAQHYRRTFGVPPSRTLHRD
jgi:AraC-like DNA-binding protein